MKSRQFGNVARHSWGTIEAQLQRKFENSRAYWSAVRAQLGHKVTWGTVEAQLRQKQLEHN